MGKINIKKLEKDLVGKRSGEYSPMYIYGTEMIAKYYPLVGVDRKTILTVVGSADQIISAYFFGAEEVVGFDLNKLSGFMLDLKLTALNNLEYEEFLDFFGTNKKDASLNQKLYSTIKNGLSSDSVVFFDDLYDYFGLSGKRLAKLVFFHDRRFGNFFPGEINGYLKNKKSFAKAREVLKNKKIDFFIDDITKISSKIKKKFDIINISNIPNFVRYSLRYEKNSLVTMYNKVFLPLKKLLKSGGKITFYTYSSSIYPNPRAPSGIPPLSIPKNIKKLENRGDFNVERFRFKGIFGGLDNFIVFTLKNK